LDTEVLTVVYYFPLVAFVNACVLVRVPHENQSSVRVKIRLTCVQIAVKSFASDKEVSVTRLNAEFRIFVLLGI
jgi:hypothetical protein